MLRKSFSKIWFLMIAAVVIAAGVLVWQQLQVPAEVEQPAGDETANWKTYRNEEYGFEVSYPSLFNLVEYTREEEPHIVLMWKANNATLQIGIYDNSWSRDCSEKERTGRYVVINNTRYEKCLSFIEGVVVQGLWFNMDKGNRVYSFELDNTDVFDQMLSTFRFLDRGQKTEIPEAGKSSIQSSSVIPSGWQTYTTKLGCNVSFPKDFELETVIYKLGEEQLNFPKDLKSERTIDRLDHEKVMLKSRRDTVKTSVIFIDIYRLPLEITAREWADWYYPVIGSSGYEGIVVNDMEGIEKKFYENLTKQHIGGEFIFAKGKRIITFGYAIAKTDNYDEFLEVANQILSTFRFLE